MKALHFLQNDVSKTVDHNDPEEATIFRSLLSHLLVPSAINMPTISRQSSHCSSTAGPDSESEDHGAPPRKRSRQSTPEEAWTSELDEDEAMVDDGSSSEIAPVQPRRAIISMEEDPEEQNLRKGAAPLTAARFQQRNEVFEALLEFVGEDAKQPSGNLLDMMNGIEEVL